MFYDQGFRPDLEDILDYLDYNRHFLVPCLDAPMSSVVMEDTDSLEMALPSGQTTMAPGAAQSLFPRRSGSWQDKIASAARKTFSVPGFASKSHSSKAQSRTFLPTPALDRVQSSSVGAMQSGSAMESLLCEEEGDLTRSTSCLKQMSSVGTSERGDSGERGDSDYFSDYSKELCQTITTVWPPVPADPGVSCVCEPWTWTSTDKPPLCIHTDVNGVCKEGWIRWTGDLSGEPAVWSSRLIQEPVVVFQGGWSGMGLMTWAWKQWS